MIQSKQIHVKGKEFTLEDVKGPVNLAQKVSLQPGCTIKMKGIMQVKGHSKQINVVTEPIEKEGPIEPVAIMTVPMYTVCKPGSNRATVVLQNMTQETVVLQKGKIVTHITAANFVPNKLAPKFINRSLGRCQVDAEQLENGMVDAKWLPKQDERVRKLFEKVDLKGIENWTEGEQKKFREVLAQYNDISH